MKKDLYEILGVKENATFDEIKAAHRKKVKQSHPDINKDEKSCSIFEEVTTAYKILINPDLREKYDNGEDPSEKRIGLESLIFNAFSLVLDKSGKEEYETLDFIKETKNVFLSSIKENNENIENAETAIKKLRLIQSRTSLKNLAYRPNIFLLFLDDQIKQSLNEIKDLELANIDFIACLEILENYDYKIDVAARADFQKIDGESNLIKELHGFLGEKWQP
jgi:curved DNA-binding protein CbpA